MSETPKRPDEGESTLGNTAPPAWNTVAAPVFRQALPPQIPAACSLPVSALPPSSAAPLGQAGYRPVYDGGVAMGTPPVGAYGGQQAPYGQGYPQSSYGQPNMAEMFAMAALMSQRRRMGRIVVFWTVLCCAVIGFALLHGCMGLIRMF